MVLGVIPCAADSASGKLAMRGRGGMHHKRFHVGHVGKQRKQLQIVDESPCGLFAAFYLEREMDARRSGNTSYTAHGRDGREGQDG